MPTPTLQIYSAIGFDPTTGTGLSAADFGAQLAGAEASGERRVAVRINSGGGNWAEGQSMYDMLSASPLKVDTYCVGLVASAATLPFMAGDKRLIAAHGRLMIHNCASGAIGGIDDLQNAISQQNAINGSMAALYASVSGQSVEDCAAMMAATTFLTAQQALDLGFATGIVDDGAKALAPPAALLVTASANAAPLHSYYANLLSASDMKNLLLPVFAAAGVKLSASASDDDVAKAVATAFADADDARAAFKKAKADADDARAAADDSDAKAKAALAALADFEAKAKADDEMAAKAKVIALVDGAIATGKITAGLKDTFLTLATADFTAASAALAGLTGRKSAVEYTAAHTPTAADTAVTVPLSAAGAMGEIQARLAR